jgi:hypothetical protein
MPPPPPPYMVPHPNQCKSKKGLAQSYYEQGYTTKTININHQKMKNRGGGSRKIIMMP